MLCDHAREWEGQGNANEVQRVLLRSSCSGAARHFWLLNLGFGFILFSLKTYMKMAMGLRGVMYAAGEVGSSITGTCCSWRHRCSLKLGIGLCSPDPSCP